ncbi:hypothetical protein SESBI_12810 [Sesbania bispinosa]|nr:hypothetical protein SESBI_12810 [Sesbania bispinosa]
MPNDIDTWEIKGVTPKQDNTNSALWVLDWMSMEYTFQPNIHGVMNKERVRMRTALSLLLGAQNEMRKTVATRAEVFYHTRVRNEETSS